MSDSHISPELADAPLSPLDEGGVAAALSAAASCPISRLASESALRSPVWARRAVLSPSRSDAAAIAASAAVNAAATPTSSKGDNGASVCSGLMCESDIRTFRARSRWPNARYAQPQGV